MDHSLIEAAEPKRNISGAFAFDCPIHVFEKASAPEGKRRRIGGVCTTDRKDRQGEDILQSGLEWEDFVQNGWFNDNHLNGTTDVLGYPDKQEGIIPFKVGDILPDGSQAIANGTWVEGWLLPTKKADEIWDLATALQGTGRSLGFSVEGNIVKRSGAGNKTIAKAKIRNVAITNCPVNTDAKLEILARSLAAIDAEEARKAMGGGDALPNANVPMTGNDGGAPIRPENLESDVHNNASRDRKRKRKRNVQKGLSTAEAMAYVRARVPGAGDVLCQQVVHLTRDMLGAGIL